METTLSNNLVGKIKNRASTEAVHLISRLEKHVRTRSPENYGVHILFETLLITAGCLLSRNEFLSFKTFIYPALGLILGHITGEVIHKLRRNNELDNVERFLRSEGVI